MPSNAFADLSLQQLKKAVTIREKIESLEKELSRIIGTGTPGVTKAPRKKRKVSAAARAKISARMKARWAKRKGKGRVSKRAGVKAKGRSRGAPLKDRIVSALKAAGKSGVTIKDLASKLGNSYGSVNVWLRTTAKGIKEIKKVEPGRFAWVS